MHGFRQMRSLKAARKRRFLFWEFEMNADELRPMLGSTPFRPMRVLLDDGSCREIGRRCSAVEMERQMYFGSADGYGKSVPRWKVKAVELIERTVIEGEYCDA